MIRFDYELDEVKFGDVYVYGMIEIEFDPREIENWGFASYDNYVQDEDGNTIYMRSDDPKTTQMLREIGDYIMDACKRIAEEDREYGY